MKINPVFQVIFNIHLLDEREVFYAFLFEGHKVNRLRTFDNCGCQQNSFGLFRKENFSIGPTVQKKKGESVPSDSSDPLEIIFEIVVVNVFKANWLGMEVENVSKLKDMLLSLFFLQVLGLGICCSFLKLLIIFYEIVDDIFGSLLLFQLLNVLSSEFLGLLYFQGVHFLIVLLDVFVFVLIFLLILLSVRFFIWIFKLYRLQGVVAHLQQLIKIFGFELFQINLGLSPVKLSWIKSCVLIS